MTFDEWLDTVDLTNGVKLHLLLQLVRAQRKLVLQATELMAFYRKDIEEIAALEAALMGDSNAKDTGA